MWSELTSADIGRAKQDLDNRRAATFTRHTEELQKLQAKHEEETQSLNAKGAELELLDTMIDRFTTEFKQEAVPTEVVEATELPKTVATIATETGESANTEGDGGVSVGSSVPVHSRGLLEVRFPSPNFGAFRRFG